MLNLLICVVMIRLQNVVYMLSKGCPFWALLLSICCVICPSPHFLFPTTSVCVNYFPFLPAATTSAPVAACRGLFSAELLGPLLLLMQHMNATGETQSKNRQTGSSTPPPRRAHCRHTTTPVGRGMMGMRRRKRIHGHI